MFGWTVLSGGFLNSHEIAHLSSSESVPVALQIKLLRFPCGLGVVKWGRALLGLQVSRLPTPQLTIPGPLPAEQCRAPPCWETAGKLPARPHPAPQPRPYAECSQEDTLRRTNVSPNKSRSRLGGGVCWCPSPGVEGCPNQVWPTPGHSSEPEATNSTGCGRAGGTTCPPPPATP